MEALQLMRLRRIRRIPIVADGHLVGLLTEGDLKRAEPSTLSHTQEEFTQVMEATPVNRIMIKNLITTAPEAPLAEAARTLWTSKGVVFLDAYGGHDWVLRSADSGSSCGPART